MRDLAAKGVFVWLWCGIGFRILCVVIGRKCAVVLSVGEVGCVRVASLGGIGIVFCFFVAICVAAITAAAHA